MTATSISAVLITQDEELKIRRALSTLSQVADEIVVVDSGSQDRTEEICREFTARFHHQEWSGYRAQKQKATDLASHNWILSLDADEALSEQLAKEIGDWKERDPEHSGYEFSRKSFFMGRWIEHTSWFPDWQMRLFDRRQGQWTGDRVHESFRVGGSRGRFRGVLEHYSYATVSEFLVQLERFSSLAAADARDRGRSARVGHFLLLPPLAFFRNYVLKKGFLDGAAGFHVSCLAACSVYFRLLKLSELRISGQEKLR